MKKSEEKQKLVEELIGLSKRLDINRLYAFPNQNDTQKWIADVRSVLKTLDESDYQEFVRLSKTVGLSENREERKKAAKEINQFLKGKVAEYKRYDFRDLDKKENSARGKTIGILNEGKGTKAKKNVFKANEDGFSLKNMGIAGIIIFIIIVAIALILGYRPTNFTLSPQPPFIEIEFDSSKNDNLSDSQLPSTTSEIRPFETGEVRPLEPLETGKDINKLPDGIFGFTIASNIVLYFKFPEYSSIKLSNRNFENYEIQKFNGVMLLIGFIGEEGYSTIGEVSESNQAKMTLFPQRWNNINRLVAIPLNSISEIESRRVDVEERDSLFVLDLTTGKIRTDVTSHISE